MTDKEILNYISKTSSNICGRVQEDQLNRLIEQPQERKRYSFNYLWSLLIASQLISNKSAAQVKPATGTTFVMPVGNTNSRVLPIRAGGIITVHSPEKPNWQITGRVVDEQQQPVAFATVLIKGTKMGAATDSAGVFLLTQPRRQANLEIQISSVGFSTKSFRLNADDYTKSVAVKNAVVHIAISDIVLVALEKTLLGEVVVAVSPNSRMRGALGMVTCVRYSYWEKFKNAIAGAEIKVYPNPIQPKAVFNIVVNTKRLGMYALQFTDAGGRVLLDKQINIVSKNQLETFNGNMFNAAGIYFVSISSKHSADKYTSKLLVQ